MISPLRATAIIGAGTVVTLVMGVIVAKALALLVGPEGVGHYGILHSVLGLAVIVAGLGVNTAIVRELAAALAQGDAPRVAALLRAGRLTVLSAGAVAAAAVIAFREPIATVTRAVEAQGADVAILAPALLFQLIAGWELGVLNGHHRIRSLTIAAGATSIIGGGLTLGVVTMLGRDGIPYAILLSAMAAAAVAFLTQRKSLGSPGPTVASSIRLAARDLLRFGTPYTASQLAGTGALLLVPILILGVVGADGVGHFRAATTISIAYLAFLLNAMAQDYLPRAAAASAGDLTAVIERQTRILMAVATPLILAMLGVAPVMVSVLYTDEFHPAVAVLQWQLVGDLLKLPAWAISFVLLARASSVRFLSLELVGGASLVALVLILTPLMGLAGAGVAFAAGYAIYYVAAWLLVRPVIPVAPGRVQVTAVGLTVASTAILLAMPVADLARGMVFGAAAMLLAAIAWPWLWRLHRTGALR